MRRRISSFLLGRFAAEAATSSDTEICGLLLGRGAAVLDAASAPNVSYSPRDSFLVDPAVHLNISRRARAAGLEILGCYHSHPGGDLTPSAKDAEHAVQAGFLWLILGSAGARLWISRADGSFDPVDMNVVDTSPCNLEPQSPIEAQVCETTGAYPE